MHWIARLIRSALSLLALVLLVPASFACPQAAPAPVQAPQPTTGSIRGVVSGASGELYQGVSVRLTEDTPNAPRPLTQTTTADGAFEFPAVPPGPFHLTLSSSGFVTKTLAGTLHAGETYDAHTIVLPVAATSSSVQVTASEHEVAQAQLNVEEKQRVLGIVPNFYVTYDPHAAPLSTRQKFQLAWKSNIDPVTWLATGAFAGIEQAQNTFPGYGQGAQGYAKRFGANYADGFIGDMLGGAVFPMLFKQDPRYFVKGTGSVGSRIWYVTYNTVMCKGDNGRWQVNYSAILGGLAAGGISNLYYPASDRNGAAVTFEGAGVGMAFGAVENFFQEFVVKKLTPHAGKSKNVQP